MNASTILRDANMAAIAAGVTTFIWYVVGMVPVQIAAVGQFGLRPEEVSSWIFIIWASGAVASIALSLVYKQPIPITSTIPGLLFMATLAGSYSYPELLGANLVAGLVIMTLGLLRIGGRLLDWLPMPLAMGMLGGSILADVSRAVTATVGDAVVAGATVGGYLFGRTIRNQRVPPVSLALVFGAVAVLATGRFSPAALTWHLPSVVMPPMELSLSSIIAVSLPMVVLSMGLGNIQGLGFLRSQGYQVPVNMVTFVLGLSSVVNAFFGGHAAIVSRNGMPIMASSEAGPVGGRYWANLVSAGLTIIIAVAAYPVASLFAALPLSYVLALAGVAILPSFQNAVEQAFSGKMRFGAIVAFIVVERDELIGHWLRVEAPEQRREPRLPIEVRPSAAFRIAGRRRTPLVTLIRDLSDHGLSVPLSLAVNLSVRQLQDPDLVEDIAQALWYTHLDPSALSIELTESALMDDPETVGETPRRLKRLGIRLVLDDFGAGPSSLRRLSQLPIDALKIDTSLVSGIDSDGSQAAMLKSIIGVATSLGLEVTAEGIETWGQHSLLRQLGCQRGQGYFFARPQPAEEIADLLSPSLPALLAPSARKIPA